jgi:catechol 2,3-dioxygenase-like lactoylglutathione lyase family enzyme
MKTSFLIFIAGIAIIGAANEPSPARMNHLNTPAMKLTPGITTTKLKQTKEFYQRVLHFGVSFENDFFLILHTPDRKYEISFLQAGHPSQQPIFQGLYEGKGMYLTIDVPDVDAEYRRIKDLGIKPEVDLREEPWGDRHFAFADPNGIGIDVVTYKAPQNN